jgi:hypothetical protein
MNDSKRRRSVLIFAVKKIAKANWSKLVPLAFKNHEFGKKNKYLS